MPQLLFLFVSVLIVWEQLDRVVSHKVSYHCGREVRPLWAALPRRIQNPTAVRAHPVIPVPISKTTGPSRGAKHV